MKAIDKGDLVSQLLKDNPDLQSYKKEVNMKRFMIPEEKLVEPEYLGVENNVCHDYNWYEHEASAWKNISVVDSVDEENVEEENYFEDKIALWPKITAIRQKRDEQDQQYQRKAMKKKDYEPLPPEVRLANQPKKKDKDKKKVEEKVPDDNKMDINRFKEAVEKTKLDYDTYSEMHDKFKKYEAGLLKGTIVMEYDKNDFFAGNKRKLSVADKFST